LTLDISCDPPGINPPDKPVVLLPPDIFKTPPQRSEKKSELAGFELAAGGEQNPPSLDTAAVETLLAESTVTESTLMNGFAAACTLFRLPRGFSAITNSDFDKSTLLASQA
jgi:hypothetical protein